MNLHLTSDDPEMKQLVKAALENYALFNTMAGIKANERPLHEGEDAATRAKRVITYERRAAAVTAMAEQIQIPKPAGQGRPSAPPPGDPPK